jgi:two-component system OmpR family response regulator
MARKSDVDSHQQNLLIISDDPQYGKLLKYGFELAGFTSALVAEGEDPVRAIDATNPSALLLDISMAVTEGLQLLHTLRAAGRQEMVILVLSSSDDRAFSVESLVAGAQDVVVKPAPFSTIMERLQRLLESTPVQEEHG